jgi:mannose-6-phosphate isomerase-like protein (cupin superfamily)
VWHVHEATDELFLCLAGRFVVHLRDRDVVLHPGQLFVVPKGTEHKPEAEPGTRILMLEPRGTLTVGDRHEGDVSHVGVHAGIDVDA